MLPILFVIMSLNVLDIQRGGDQGPLRLDLKVIEDKYNSHSVTVRGEIRTLYGSALKQIVITRNNEDIIDRSFNIPRKTYQISESVPLTTDYNIIRVLVSDTTGKIASQTFSWAPLLPNKSRPDVDISIPKVDIRKPDAVAVVIGITDYQNEDPVDFARRDGEIVRQYLLSMMGFERRNILTAFDEEASLGAIRRLIEVELPRKVNSNSEVFFFYSGHGLPDLENNQSFLMPYDGVHDAPKQTCYSLNDLMRELDNLRAAYITGVIDACFSGSYDGGTLFPNTSGIGVVPRDIEQPIKNGNVFLAASGTERAYWYSEQNHGMLSYFFLLGLRGVADANGDNQISIVEMVDHINATLPEEVAKTRGGKQTPEVTGNGDKNHIIVRMQ